MFNETPIVCLMQRQAVGLYIPTPVKIKCLCETKQASKLIDHGNYLQLTHVQGHVRMVARGIQIYVPAIV